MNTATVLRHLGPLKMDPLEAEALEAALWHINALPGFDELGSPESFAWGIVLKRLSSYGAAVNGLLTDVDAELMNYEKILK